jgi:flagellar motor component MotA
MKEGENKLKPYHKENPFICRILKKIVEGTREEHIKELALEATVMAKKMNKKLKEYFIEAQIRERDEK